MESFVSDVNTLQTKQCTFTSSVVRGSKKRQYYCGYLTFGFPYTGNEEYPDGFWLLCSKTFFNMSLVPAKLKRHFEISHSSYQNKHIAFFERKLQFFKNPKCLMAKKLKTKPENAAVASYKASYHIALAGNAHTIDELLIKPVMTDVASCVFDEESVEKLKPVFFVQLHGCKEN